MALIKCIECGSSISDKATTCVHCGCPVSYSVAGLEVAAASVAEPVAEPVAAPAAEPVAEPVAKPVAAPVEPTPAPAAELVAEPVKTFGGMPVVTSADEPNRFTTGDAALDEIFAGMISAGGTRKTNATGAASATSAASEAINAIKAYQPNHLVQFYASRRFYILATLYVGLIVYTLFDSGLYFASVCAGGLAPIFVPMIMGFFMYPPYHTKKYFAEEGVDVAIRNDSGSMDVAIAAYNAMPKKAMLKYIAELNPAAGQNIERQLAAQKGKK